MDLSISLSLSSPRMKSLPHSHDLLGLLSIHPDGLSDGELLKSDLPINNIPECKATLIRTSLANSDEHKCLKALVPVREYVHKTQPPADYLVRPLLKYFQEFLKLYKESRGTHPSSAMVSQLSSVSANIQNVLHNGLREGDPDLSDSI
jgi:hypothetical protein